MMLIAIGPGIGIPGGMTPWTMHVIEATGRPPMIIVGLIVVMIGPGAGPAAKSPRHEAGIPLQIIVGHPGPVIAFPVAFNPVKVAIGVMSHLLTSTLKPCNFSTFQPFNFSTFQPLNFSSSFACGESFSETASVQRFFPKTTSMPVLK